MVGVITTHSSASPHLPRPIVALQLLSEVVKWYAWRIVGKDNNRGMMGSLCMAAKHLPAFERVSSHILISARIDIPKYAFNKPENK